MPYKDKENQKKWQREAHNKARQMLRETKERPCADCGVQYPWFIMEFDHLPEHGPKKKNRNLATFTSRSFNAKGLQDELAKCEVVCANCHRARTHKRREAVGHASVP